MQNVANSIASLLRLNKIQTEIDITGRNMKKQMENASTSKFVIIVGPQELEDGNVTLRNMINGSENTLSIEELTEDPRKFLI
jgi:histidyl-tRNA synthetase